MKKLLFRLIPAIFFCVGLIGNSLAQTGIHPIAAGKFDVQFAVKNVDCSASPQTVTIAVQVRATSIADTFLMGDANYRFKFKTTQLNLLGVAPFYVPSLVSQDNFSSAFPSSNLNYGQHNLNGSGEGPTEGIVSLNTFYGGSAQGAKLVGTSWMTVACIKFKVVSGGDCFDITWNNDSTIPVTGMSEVYDLKLGNSFDYKTASVMASGYFGNVNSCTSTLCSSAIIAQDDMNVTSTGMPVSGQVLTNDVGTGLVVTTTPLVNVTNGTLILNANGTYTYTPAAGFTGTDSFVYEVCDNSVPKKCTTATVVIKTIAIPCPVK
jgi:Bacterial Ig domain